MFAGGPATLDKVVTAGADQTVRILDPNMNFAEIGKVQLTDFPYSMAAAGGLALVGCGDGTLFVIDIDTATTLYGLGANAAAVRTVNASTDRLVCSGSDGKVITYSF